MTTPELSRVQWRKSSWSGNSEACVEVAAIWQKSSYSSGNSQCVEVADAWLKSSHSSGDGECVEVASVGDPSERGDRVIAVRDSKNPDGPKLHFTPGEWQAFTGSVKNVPFGMA
jgi:hypothetical protein